MPEDRPAPAPDFSHEAAATWPVCGIDEVGRGPWAGPVVAAAVILRPETMPDGLDDSKRLSAERREELYALLQASAVIGVGRASVAEIVTMNILQASFLAMRRAVAALRQRPAMALVDGHMLPPGLPCPGRAVIGGDGRAVSIAAASIIAKVTRDRLMVTLSQQFPGYGWDTNMGYGTRAHADALGRLGATPHHRRSFEPVHKILCEASLLSS
jgi:ribonuclease HII